MLTTIEETYNKGTIILRETPPGLQEGRVLVTFLPESEAKPTSAPGQMRFGQFSGDVLPTEEDFKIAEWHGETVALLTCDGNITASGLVPIIW
jgi:hypothetical protein